MNEHGSSPYKFYVCLNLGNISPENVQAYITDRIVDIIGKSEQVTEEADGMIRRNYHGFSNKFGLPPGVDPNTLVLTVPDGRTLIIEAEYLKHEDQNPNPADLTCPRMAPDDWSRSIYQHPAPPVPMPRTVFHTNPAYEPTSADENSGSLISSRVPTPFHPVPMPRQTVMHNVSLPSQHPMWYRSSSAIHPRTMSKRRRHHSYHEGMAADNISHIQKMNQTF